MSGNHKTSTSQSPSYQSPSEGRSSRSCSSCHPAVGVNACERRATNDSWHKASTTLTELAMLYQSTEFQTWYSKQGGGKEALEARVQRQAAQLKQYKLILLVGFLLGTCVLPWSFVSPWALPSSSPLTLSATTADQGYEMQQPTMEQQISGSSSSTATAEVSEEVVGEGAGVGVVGEVVGVVGPTVDLGIWVVEVIKAQRMGSSLLVRLTSTPPPPPLTGSLNSTTTTTADPDSLLFLSSFTQAAGLLCASVLLGLPFLLLGNSRAMVVGLKHLFQTQHHVSCSSTNAAATSATVSFTKVYDAMQRSAFLADISQLCGFILLAQMVGRGAAVDTTRDSSPPPPPPPGIGLCVTIIVLVVRLLGVGLG